ncbi:hypothetical protein GCM10023069_71040 [Shinella granuli]|uniref:Uncharacterized protein n=1 Tax=Shinella granuli TaxID=323621 RepID=A0A4R2C3B6_SHIGR|nr:hypothetical protein EV665_13226 [Shinella granuli]
MCGKVRDFDEFAKMADFNIKNYMGLKSVITIHWRRKRTGGSLIVELTAEQCMELSAQLLDQAKILLLERPTTSQ